MTQRIIAIMVLTLVVGCLSGCISGIKSPDTYTSRNGTVTTIESDKEMCTRSCNDDFDRCMETTPAQNNEGVTGAATGMFGASADCRNDLKNCLPGCKAR